MRLRSSAAAVVTALAVATLPAVARQAATGSFAQTTAAVSEPGGDFDTDNLVSNESSYPQVIPELDKRGVHGGAYLGVGPDQNFTYMAAVRPSVAFIVDVRRDNLLLHVLFKALFKASSTRVEYLSLMLVDTDPSGRQTNFLTSEDAFQFVRGLENRDLVIPVVGDLAGPSAIASIGRLLAGRGEHVSAYYVSNVEFYLFREGAFARFIANLQRLPRSGNSVVIRSIFSGRYAVGGARPGEDSVSQLQTIDELLSGYANGRIRMYADLIRRP